MPPGRSPGLSATAIRLAAGLVGVASDELRSRLAAIPEDLPSGESSGGGASRDGTRPTVLNVATGLAVVSTMQASRLVAHARDVGARISAEASLVEHLPVVGRATGPLRRGYRRYQAAVLSLSRTGRREELEGRRIILHLIDDTTTSSVKDIAESAVKQVAESPEVAALVRAQSAGIATDTVRDVRTISEQADQTVERRVRTWLHLLRADDAPDTNGTPGGNKPAA